MKNKKSNVANLLEAQWERGKALPRGNRGTPWKKAPKCDHPPTAIQKAEGRQRGDVQRTMRDVWNPWQRIPLTMVARDPETKLNNRTVLASHREDQSRSNAPFVDDAGHAAAEPPLGMLDVQYNLRTQPGRVRCSTCRPGGASRVPTRT